MSFLALSTAEALVLAGSTALIVIVLFFMKLRHRRIVVGSALLWQRVLNERNKSSWTEKLRHWMSLVLALAIALLLALALGRPHIAALGGQMRPVVVVLDTSPSMATLTSSGRTRWELAVDHARRIIEGSSSAAKFMVTDTAGRIQTALIEDREQAYDAIGRMQPFVADSPFPKVPVGANVHFVTDGVGQYQLPANIEVASVFEPAINVGITAFDIKVDPTSPSGYAAYLEIANYSREGKNVAINISGAGAQRVNTTARLEPGEVLKRELDLAEFRGGGMRVGIRAAGDAFGLDDTAYGYLPVRNHTRAVLVTVETDGYLETLLRLSPNVDVTVVRPAGYRETPSVDVYIFEGIVPPEAPSKPSLVFGAGDAGWLPTRSGTETDPAVASWDSEHPVMRLVPLYDVTIEGAGILDARDYRIVASSDRTPLILVDETAPQRVFAGFGLDESDFALHLGFPIFVQNVLNWFSGETPAEQRGLGVVELPIAATSVTSLDAANVETTERFGRSVIEVTEPNLFTATGDGRRIRVAANLTDPVRSNINGSSLAQDASGAAASLPALGNELWFYMIFATLLLIGLEWWTYHRRITL